MEAEFDRLDKDKSGDLDAKDLEQSKVRVSHFTMAVCDCAAPHLFPLY
jgi:hypothetical protein